MTTIEDLTTRMETAMQRIRVAVDTVASAPVSGDGALAEKVETLTHENLSLQNELQDMKAQRDRDLAELDSLVAQLKPLIGED